MKGCVSSSKAAKWIPEKRRNVPRCWREPFASSATRSLSHPLTKLRPWLLSRSRRGFSTERNRCFRQLSRLPSARERKAPRHRAGSSAGKFGTRRALNWTGQSAAKCSAPNGGGQLAKKSRPEVSSPKAPRATLLGFPWKPANVYLPRSTMHPWRCIHNSTKVASRMARTCRSI
jgi:hypothetical protein